MSNAEILAELPKLKAEERMEVLKLLCELPEKDLPGGTGASESEKRILDHALAEYQDDRATGTPWRVVIEELRTSSPWRLR